MGASDNIAATEMIKKFDKTFLVCRAIGHGFNEGTSQVERSGGKFYWSMICSRCEAVRTKVMGPQGRIERNVYKYPEGYVAPGIGRLDASGMGHLRMHVAINVLGS